MFKLCVIFLISHLLLLCHFCCYFFMLSLVFVSYFMLYMYSQTSTFGDWGKILR
ncbi:hypothetical protein IC575_016573 [Cucumis melo]